MRVTVLLGWLVGYSSGLSIASMGGFTSIQTVMFYGLSYAVAIAISLSHNLRPTP